MSLHELAERGLHGQILRTIEREIDVDINEKDKFGRTPLQWAAEQGHVSTVEILVDLGADIDQRDNMGRTAVHLAARSGEVEVLEALIANVDVSIIFQMVNAPDLKGITPVFLAKQKGLEGEDAFRFLLKHGAVYNQQLDKNPTEEKQGLHLTDPTTITTPFIEGDADQTPKPP